MKLAEVLKAAGEPTRLRLLNLLRQGSICVCDLQAVLGLPQPTISRHLAILWRAELVLDERDGTRVFYRLAPATTAQLKAFRKFLVQACSCEEGLRQDLKALHRATAQGECRLLSPESAKQHPGLKGKPPSVRAAR
jgi:ArsR family transcriptional regulator